MVRIRMEMIARDHVHVDGCTGSVLKLNWIELLEMKFACHAGNSKIKRLKYDRGGSRRWEIKCKQRYDYEKSKVSKDMIIRRSSVSKDMIMRNQRWAKIWL